jgi:hypothetical protein
MRPRWIAIPALVAALVVFATAAVASASATEPYFKLTKGSFPATFEVRDTEAVTLEYAAGDKFNCTGMTATGEIVGSAEFEHKVSNEMRKVVEKFEGCKVALRDCGSAGTVESKPLKGTLGYVEKGSLQPAGLELEGEAKPESGEQPLFASFACPELEGPELRGHLIGLLEARINEKKASMNLVYTQEHGNQGITNFEGGPSKQQLQAKLFGGTENVGIVAKEDITSLKNSAKESTELEVVEQSPLWTIQSFPSGSGAKGSEARSVSCVSSKDCEGVGHYENSSKVIVTLADEWNGTAWTVQSTPNPTEAKASRLLGVSCSSSTACTAVGYYTNSAGVQVTLAERWNGTAWAVQSTPNPTEAKSSQLDGVSCASASECTAVGYYENSAKAIVSLAERWNGTTWTIQSTPSPAEAKASRLLGVSCSSSTACTAVGYYTNSAGVQVTLAERWNGTAWAVQSTPNPTEAKSSSLKGVSCVSSTVCTAVGTYSNGAGTGVTLVERWNGTEWTVQSAPTEAKASTTLSSISCTSSSACMGVGEAGTAPFTERWNGTEWTIVSAAQQGGASFLEGVSCVSSIECLAVGGGLNGELKEVPVAERYYL